MDSSFVENVYQSLIGNLIIPVDGVQNEFDEGKYCDIKYDEIYAAYERLREKLNIDNEDEDIEIIINNMNDIQHFLCMRMFKCGVKFAE